MFLLILINHNHLIAENRSSVKIDRRQRVLNPLSHPHKGYLSVPLQSTRILILILILRLSSLTGSTGAQYLVFLLDIDEHR